MEGEVEGGAEAVNSGEIHYEGETWTAEELGAELRHFAEERARLNVRILELREENASMVARGWAPAATYKARAERAEARIEELAASLSRVAHEVTARLDEETARSVDSVSTLSARDIKPDNSRNDTQSKENDHEQGIPGPHAERDGQDEGEGDRGGVRRVPGAAGVGVRPGPRAGDHEDENGGGVLLRQEGDGQRSDERSRDAVACSSDARAWCSATLGDMTCGLTAGHGERCWFIARDADPRTNDAEPWGQWADRKIRDEREQRTPEPVPHCGSTQDGCKRYVGNTCVCSCHRCQRTNEARTVQRRCPGCGDFATVPEYRCQQCTGQAAVHVPWCADHAPERGGVFGQCLACACRRLSQALSQIDAAIDVDGKKDDPNYAALYDAFPVEDDVVKRVQSFVGQRADCPRSDEPGHGYECGVAHREGWDDAIDAVHKVLGEKFTRRPTVTGSEPHG